MRVIGAMMNSRYQMIGRWLIAPGAGLRLLANVPSNIGVLPQVKEAHMYATFTALRLNLDGQSFYGMAACPPLLHWSAANNSVTRIQEEQFPLGLLPVSAFPACQLVMGMNDVVLIA